MLTLWSTNEFDCNTIMGRKEGLILDGYYMTRIGQWSWLPKCGPRLHWVGKESAHLPDTSGHEQLLRALYVNEWAFHILTLARWEMFVFIIHVYTKENCHPMEVSVDWRLMTIIIPQRMVEWEYINLDHSKFVWSTLLSGYAYSIILLLDLFFLFCWTMAPKQTLFVLLYCLSYGLNVLRVLFVCDPFRWVPDVGIEEDSCVWSLQAKVFQHFI